MREQGWILVECEQLGALTDLLTAHLLSIFNHLLRGQEQ